VSERVEQLYAAARALPTEAREAFVRDACPDEPGLRDELLSLLHDAEAAEEFFGLLGSAMASRMPPHGAVAADRSGGASGGAADERPRGRFAFPDLSVGQMVARYRILQRVGAGGMGAIYRARDERLARDVALKFLPAHREMNPEAQERLLVEARAAAGLEHPNVCTIHEVGETEAGQPFIAMAFYTGETLKERLRRGPLREAEVVNITRQLVRGLAAAHAHGIVHRDVKPGNVMLAADGTVKLLDFGLAASVDVTGESGAGLFGTLPYMSPEQIRRAPLDQRTDLWSLGVVLYEMLTGVRPFRGGDERALLEVILHGEAEPVTTHRRDIDEGLARIVRRLLQKDPAARYARAEDLLADLARSDPPTVESAGPRVERLESVRVAAGVAAILVTLAGFGVWLRGAAGPRAPARSGGRTTPIVAAYESYLHGSDPSLLRSDSGVHAGVEYFRRAIALDSTYAAAHAGLAVMYVVLGTRNHAGTSAEELHVLAERAASTAVALDDSLAEAHAALALVRWQTTYDMHSAETELGRAIVLEPGRARYREWLAQLCIQTGRPHDALIHAERALELDPLSPSAHAEVAHALLANGRYAEALERLERIAAVQPPLLRAATYAAQAYAKQGRWSEAAAVLGPQAAAGGTYALALRSFVLARAGRRADALRLQVTLLDRWRAGTSGAFEVAVSYAGLGDLEQAFAWLDRAVDDRSIMRPNVNIMEPVFEDLRRDPRFAAISERLGRHRG